MLYRKMPDGRQVIVGVEIAGQKCGGIISCVTGADAQFPGPQPYVQIRAWWPVRWKDVAIPDVLVAGQMPILPFPQRG